MTNENSNSNPVSELMRERAINTVNEDAAEVNFRSGQFIRAYNNPTTDAATLVSRAKLYLESCGRFNQFVEQLIKTYENENL